MTVVLLLAGHLAVGTNEARAETAEGDTPVEATGPSLDRSEAEELIFRYLAQDLPLLVGMSHRAEYVAELKADPPHFDAHDRYHFNPPGGILEFEYDGERGALIVRAAIHRYRGRQQGHGLSFEQISEAVHQYGQSRASLGGGWLDTALKLDGVFLRRDFMGPQSNARQFARQVDDLVDAANRWSRNHYLKALKAYALTLAPPASATAEADGFRATMALTANPELYARIWSRPPGAMQPWHISAHTAKPGTELVLAIHIVDPAADSEGLARVEATTRLLGPEGVERGAPSEVVLWHKQPPPAGHFQLTDRPISVGFAAAEPEGTFRVLAEVCDRVAEKCVQLTHPVAIVNQPGAAVTRNHALIREPGLGDSQHGPTRRSLSPARPSPALEPRSHRHLTMSQRPGAFEPRRRVVKGRGSGLPYGGPAWPPAGGCVEGLREVATRRRAGAERPIERWRGGCSLSRAAMFG